MTLPEDVIAANKKFQFDDNMMDQGIKDDDLNIENMKNPVEKKLTALQTRLDK